MSGWDDITPQMQRLARDVCTAKQLHALVMRQNGLTLEQIAQRMGITRPTVHKHLAAAHHKIRARLVSHWAASG